MTTSEEMVFRHKFLELWELRGGPWIGDGIASLLEWNEKRKCDPDRLAPILPAPVFPFRIRESKAKKAFLF